MLFKFDKKRHRNQKQKDFNVLRETFNSIPKIVTNLANLCLSFKFFSLVLRVGEVIYFLKQRMIDSEQKSCRLICLLPTSRKLLKKLLLNRLVYFLEYNNLLHNFKLVFREGSLCELELKETMPCTAVSSCCFDSNIGKGKYTILV